MVISPSMKRRTLLQVALVTTRASTSACPIPTWRGLCGSHLSGTKVDGYHPFEVGCVGGVIGVGTIVGVGAVGGVIGSRHGSPQGSRFIGSMVVVVVIFPPRPHAPHELY